MTRKLKDERQQRADDRRARDEGRSPSEAGVTQGAHKQRSHETRGGHPEQKTTHPLDR